MEYIVVFSSQGKREGEGREGKGREGKGKEVGREGEEEREGEKRGREGSKEKRREGKSISVYILPTPDRPHLRQVLIIIIYLFCHHFS